MPDKPFPALIDLTGEHIAEQGRKAGEPEWMIDRRVEAWEFFAQAIPPEWRRTNLKGIHQESICPLPNPQGTAIQWDESLASRGITFMTLAAALRSHEQLVREKFGTGIDPLRHKFSAMRAALWQDGIFLHVPAHVMLDVPLRACYTLADGSRSIFPYSLIVLEPGAQISFIEDFSSRDAPEPSLACPTTEIFLGSGSTLRFASVQQWGANVYHLGGQVQVCGSDARSEWVSVTLGGQTQHVEAEARMQGDGSSVRWRGVTFTNQEQHMLTAPILRHIGAHTESDLDFRTVVTDKSYSVFDGMIKIEKGSRATTTRLEEHAFHLTPESRSDSIPGLKIDTNDVLSAGHASTSGQLEEEQLFYLMSRGIQRSEAIRMIVMGVFEPALNAIPSDELREVLTSAIEAKI